jgi:PhzF family phenazine biosynthesis protein
MAELRLRTVDAFTDRPFAGNPAAVVVLDQAPRDDWMAALAREMNLSETAFVIREALPDADFRLRWFTPTMEVDLCGHATLASAHCLLEDGVSSPIRFATRSGVLTVSRLADGSLSMDFPAAPAVQVDAVPGMAEALGAPVEWTGRSRGGIDFLVGLLADELTVRELSPDLAAVASLDASGVIVTAAADPGRAYAFVSRVFAPKAGIPEDPVTGSSHAVLARFWAERLGRTSLVGMQVSARSGLVGVELRGERVAVSGRAVTVLDGVVRSKANPSY